MERSWIKDLLALIRGRHPKQAAELGLGLDRFVQARSYVMLWEMREVRRSGASLLAYLAVREAGRKHGECMKAIELGRSMLVLGANKDLHAEMRITKGGGFVPCAAQGNIDLWNNPKLNRFAGTPGGGDSLWARPSTVPYQLDACYKASLEAGATHGEIMAAWASGIDPSVYQSAREVPGLIHLEAIDAYEHIAVIPQAYFDARLRGRNHIEAVSEATYKPSPDAGEPSWVGPSNNQERSWLDQARKIVGSMIVNLEVLHPEFGSDPVKSIQDAVDQRLADGRLVLPAGIKKDVLMAASICYARDVRETKAPLVDVESALLALDQMACRTPDGQRSVLRLGEAES